MAPVPQEHLEPVEVPQAPRQDGETVVITGMSGLYPNSSNVQELSKILYDKVNPVDCERPRWKYDHPELAQQLGKIPDLKTFDAQFFKVHFRQSNNMDPMSRKLLEQTFQAIYDAGVSPQQLSGKKVGVYIGSCFSETEKSCFYVASSRTGFGIAGCSKAMFANRISYWLNLKGPSMSIDAACASSLVALERAYMAINTGQCEAAIVGGSYLCLHPQSSVHYSRIMTLCMDGKTKSFDKNADGCARSEAINVLFLQKAKDAKRIYADVCYVKSEFGPESSEQGQRYGPYRDHTKLTSFIKQFYDEAAVSPAEVEYVEAFGSGVPEADKSELEAISTVLCKDRVKPLLVGSVMSNLGYAEAAGGISAITKVLLAYRTGQLAANLHCDNPRDDVEALREGRMRVVTEHQNFHRSFVGVSHISVTGVNVHLLLHGHYKPKDLSRYRCSFPYLVAVSGRQESGVHKILNDLKNRPIDAEEIGLLHNIHEHNIQGHLARGFCILGTNESNETVSLVEKTDYYNDAKKQLWFVYSGMGSQWAGMGIQLMRIPVFAAAIERCRVVLEPKGIDIVHIITSTDKKIFDNILHSFVGIAAIQIGLTDVLRELGIVPDKIIGHSVGELGCAYADGCFTAEEMILSAYSRGLVSVQTPFIHGSMAAVGLGYEQIKDLCPPGIEVACHNSSESSTISGPSDKMKEFVEELTSKKVFAKEVPCSNIAYHSRYIREAGPGLLKYLKEVIKSPKERTQRWLSTSVPVDKWDQPAAKYSSAEYHTNNLLSPVLFEETSKLIPSNAVLVEVAPHGLLQAILKRSLPSSCVHVPLTRRGHADNALFMLEAIGQLYMQGYNPKVEALYPKIEYPVSTETPMLSHQVEWAHNETWPLALYATARRRTAAAVNFVISLHDDEYNFLKGNVHQNKTLYPFSGALVCVWDTLAMSVGAKRHELSVQFQNVHLHEQLRLHDNVLRLYVQLQKGNGYFEVMSENMKVISGFIVTELNSAAVLYKQTSGSSCGEFSLDKEDVYKLFYERGSYYRGEFRSITRLNEDMTRAQISWTGNWVTMLDSLLQLNALRRDCKGISEPRFIRRLYIDVNEHIKINQHHDNDVAMEAQIFEVQHITRCGAVLIEDIKFNDLPQPRPEAFALKKLKFVPFYQFNNTNVLEVLNMFLQIVAENVNKHIINVVELTTTAEFSLRNEINVFEDTIPGIKVNFKQVSSEIMTKNDSQVIKSADLLIARNLSTSDNICEKLYAMLAQDVFLLSTEVSCKSSLPQALCRAVASAATTRGKLILSRWHPKPNPTASTAISIDQSSDLARLNSTRQSLSPDYHLIILSSYPPPQGLKELVQKWRKESNRNKISVAMVNHKISKDQNLQQLPNLDLVFNILDHGAWGGEFFVNSNNSTKDGETIVKLKITEPGNLNTLYWEEGPKIGLKEVAVTVHYAGLNVRDAKTANGNATYKVDSKIDLGFGMDFSGVTDSGDRVMGLIHNGAASSRVAVNPSMLWPVPAHWTLEDAATVPLAYAHAFYCIGIKCQLYRSTSLLVHGATGALGLALISIALAHGCKVFATVSDMKKKRFLRRIFPSLPDDNIGNSRNATFGDMVLHQTKGKGCSIVVSCLEGELKNVALKCTAMAGVFLDTHQISCKENYQFGMSNLLEEKNYLPVDFSSLFATQNEEEMQAIQVLISEGIARGYVRPLSRVTYEATESSRAFHLLGASQHRGRVLLHLREALPMTSKLSFSPDASQLIFGFTTDDVLIGFFVDVLIARGARNIVLQRQQANIAEKYMQVKIKKWQKLGVHVTIGNNNLVDADKVLTLIKDCVNLGPLESIFLFTTGTTGERMENELVSTLNILDAVTRSKCPSIKYFAVINEKSFIGQDVCMSRSFDRLQSTLLSLPKLNKFAPDSSKLDNENSGLSYAAAVEAIEQAVNASCPVLLAQIKQTSTSKLLNQIFTIAGVNVHESTPDNVTLEKLGFNDSMSMSVAKYMSKNANIAISDKDVPKLTIARIREIEKNIGERKISGLNVLYSYVDSDEIEGTRDIVFVPTLTHSSAVRVDEFNTDETYLVLIPGFEGHHSKFHSLCERLKLPAVALQSGLDYPNESLTEMASRLAKDMLKKLRPKKKFYLLGHSFGVLVALEMAAILEEQGLMGVVFCVDASPESFPAALDSWLREAGATDEVQLQDALVTHMYALMSGNDSQWLQNELKNTQGWHNKVEVGVRALRGHVTHSSQYARAVIEAAHARIKQARRYDAQRLLAHPLRSLLVVLRSSSQPATVELDLGLSRYSVHVPQVYNLSMDHTHALDDPRCANIVNRHLDKDIIDIFQNRNLCEAYLLNASTFMDKGDDLDVTNN